MIIALHGFTGCAESWARTEVAAGESFATPAILGHGAGAEGVRTFDEEVDRLAETGRGHWVGYSMGARLALGVAARHPERVERLTLIGVHPGLEPAAAAERAAADERLATELERDGLEAFVDRWEALPLFASQRALPEPLRRAHRRRRLGHDPRELARALRVLGLGRMPSRWAELATLAMPVEVLVGALDAKFRAIAERMERVPVRVVPGAGHDLTLEAPGAVAECLRRAAA